MRALARVSRRPRHRMPPLRESSPPLWGPPAAGPPLEDELPADAVPETLVLASRPAKRPAEDLTEGPAAKRPGGLQFARQLSSQLADPPKTLKIHTSLVDEALWVVRRLEPPAFDERYCKDVLPAWAAGIVRVRCGSFGGALRGCVRLIDARPRVVLANQSLDTSAGANATAVSIAYRRCVLDPTTVNPFKAIRLRLCICAPEEVMVGLLAGAPGVTYYRSMKVSTSAAALVYDTVVWSTTLWELMRCIDCQIAKTPHFSVFEYACALRTVLGYVCPNSQRALDADRLVRTARDALELF